MLKSAQRFSKTPIYDGYSNSLLFYARLASHDDHSSSGATSRRRTMTTDPATTAPPRAVVKALDDYWLVGTNNLDHYKGEPIRRSYDLKKVTDLANLLSPSQACLSQTGMQAYIRREWYRDQFDAMTSSEYNTMWNVFIAGSEAPAKGKFLRAAGKLLRIRNTYLAQELLWIAECDELDDGPRTASLFGKLIDPVTDKESDTSTLIHAIRMDLGKFYRYEVQSDSDYRPGDTVFLVPQAEVTPKVGQSVVWLGAEYRIRTAALELDCWALNTRLA